MITFIQARVPRTSNSKHYQQKAHFCDLSLCTDVPPPSEKNREKRFCFLREGGCLYTGYATSAFTKEHFLSLFKQGGWKGGGGEGRTVSPRKSVVQSACQYDVTSRVSDFQNGEQSVHQREG